jgi:hypothetical protein
MTGLMTKNPVIDIDELTLAGQEIVNSDEFTIDVLDGDGISEPYLIHCNGLDMSLLTIAKPIPFSSLKEPYEESILFWPEVRDDFSHHRSHIALSMNKPINDFGDFLEAAFTITVLTGAICQISDAIGTYWDDAEWLTARDDTLAAAMEACQGEPPVNQWIRLSLRPGKDDTTGIFTRGLQPFVGREIEFPPTDLMDIEDMIDRVSGLSKYLILNGLVVKDNDTVGMSRNERLLVTYKDSNINPGTPVLSLQVAG